MNFATIAFKNMGRNRSRTFMTVIGVAFTVVTFIVLRTALWSWEAGAEIASKDRIGTRHKVSSTMLLPKRYADELRTFTGIKSVAYANWFGGRDPKQERLFFPTIAVVPNEFLNVYDEIKVDPDSVAAWSSNRRGALVGDILAKKQGWKVGDHVTLTGTIYPGMWEFDISGIYTASRPSVDRSTFYFQWDYLNENIPPRRKDQIGWIMARIDDPGKSALISREIDRMFDERDIQTLTMSERGLTTSRLVMISAILRAVNAISIVILLLMSVLLGNTIAMGVMERTNEYGILRAIGFLPRHVVGFIVGEGITIGLMGGLLGLGLSYPVVQSVSRFMEQSTTGLFPVYQMQPSIALLALGLAAFLGGLAAAIPARHAAGFNVVAALRRVG